MWLEDLSVRPITPQEEVEYQRIMGSHHYLGAIPRIGETIWYVGTLDGKWVALISFSAAALKCAVRDRWIGWSYRHQTGRLNKDTRAVLGYLKIITNVKKPCGLVASR